LIALEPPDGGFQAPCDCLPCGFFPFDVFPVLGSHIPQGFQPLVKVPPQRFSRSRGFDPPRTCRPSFMPVPSMGFPFRADFHPQSRTSFRMPLPSCGWSEDPTSGFCSLRVSFSRDNSSLHRDSDPHGFPSLGKSPFSPVLRQKQSSRGLGKERVKTGSLLSCRVLPAKRLACLSRGCRPFRGFSPCRQPRN